jgi:hypothetical protein
VRVPPLLLRNGLFTGVRGRPIGRSLQHVLSAVDRYRLAESPAASRLRIQQNTNDFGLRFRARVSEGHTPRLELTRG